MRIIFFFVASTFLALNASAQNLKPKNPSIEALYHEAKKQFSDFEKTHGRFIETKNVNMHYLT